MGFVVVCERVQLFFWPFLEDEAVVSQTAIGERIQRHHFRYDSLVSKSAIGGKHRPAVLFNRNTFAEQNV